MIINIRLELTDAQRNALSMLEHPNAPKRLATRKDVIAFVDGQVRAAAAVHLASKQTEAAPPEPVTRESVTKATSAIQQMMGEPQSTTRLLFHIGNALDATGNAIRTAEVTGSESMEMLNRASLCLNSSFATAGRENAK